MKKSLSILRIIFGLSCCLLLASCQLERTVIYNFADIRDYKKFPSMLLVKSDTPFLFYQSKLKGKAPKSLTLEDGKTISFDDYLAKNKTVAFLIIQNDTLQYEHYFHGYGRQSIVLSFSMANYRN